MTQREALRIHNHRLHYSDVDLMDLAQRYGTPLHVFDEEQIQETAARFKNAFSHPEVATEVLYASKAFLTRAMVRTIDAAGLSLDVVSGGELHTAISVGFDPNRIYLHGNNKTLDELIMALNYGVKRIVVDNYGELKTLQFIATELHRPVEILLRMNPGIEAHTHDYIKTADNDSKFGISIYDEQIFEVVERLTEVPYINLRGFHYHIGSQIFEGKSYLKALTTMMEFVGKVKKRTGFITKELNLGGGFGVYYAEGDDPMDLEVVLPEIISAAIEQSRALGMTTPKLLIEPGRSLVADAGLTLYKVGYVKETFGGKKYLFVDGGMNENPRYALYGALYEARLVNRADEPAETTYAVAGKLCESGDILIPETDLPRCQQGDYLAVLGTGAYTYSMASNYNRMTRPAVIFLKEGKAQLVVKRETYDDLIRNDL